VRHGTLKFLQFTTCVVVFDRKEVHMVAALPIAITAVPLRTVRPKMLRGVYANPEKELVRLRDTGRVTQIARGTYVAKPDDIPADREWWPGLEAAAMAYATAVYGDRVPILFGIGAARFHHAIPRSINVTVVAVPASHRQLRLATGGRVVFTARDLDKIEARPERTALGLAMVATPEQTLIDLVRQPDLGGLPTEAMAAAVFLRDQIDERRLNRLLPSLPITVRNKVHDFMRWNNG
jgi:hypothetical protein